MKEKLCIQFMISQLAGVALQDMTKLEMNIAKYLATNEFAVWKENDVEEHHLVETNKE